MMDELVRENIRGLQPYSSARDENKLPATVFLDANENALGSPVNTLFCRYPDPRQRALREVIANIRDVPVEHVFLGNGSDEVIDLAIRIFCEPKKDNILICAPTYGMYEVSARINDIEVKKALLRADFSLDTRAVLENANDKSKILFLCSPNNPTGNVLNRKDIEYLLQHFRGLVVVDEAYIDFAGTSSCVQLIRKYENLLVMQTLSKAWGLAGLRIGMAFGNERLLSWFFKVKPPYNINSESQVLALEALGRQSEFRRQVAVILEERALMEEKLNTFSFVIKVFPSDANFLLLRVANAGDLYDFLAGRGIVVRNRSRDELCENTLRITIGTPAENKLLIAELMNYEKSIIY